MAEKGSPEPSNVPIKLVDWLKTSGYVRYPPFDKGKRPSEDDLEYLESSLKKLEESIAERIHSIETEVKVLSDYVIKERPRKRPPVEPEKESSLKQLPPSSLTSTSSPSSGDSKPARKKAKTNNLSTLSSSSSSSYSNTTTAAARNEGKHHPQDSSDKPVMSKTPSKSGRSLAQEDSLERLWSTVESYFQDIAEEHLAVLDDHAHPDSALLEVPPLGNHYSAQWAEQDLGNGEMMAGSEEPYPNTENDAPSEDCGPLARRLLAAFIEEDLGPRPPPARAEPVKASAFNLLRSSENYDSLELRLRKELQALGVLSSKSAEPSKPPDEVLEELIAKQKEFKAICQMNKKRLQRVRELAVKEMHRQELRRQLETVDNDIVKALHTLQSSKQKKRHISDKDRDAAKKALEKRKQIVRMLSSLD